LFEIISKRNYFYYLVQFNNNDNFKICNMNIIFLLKLTSLKRQSLFIIEHLSILTITYNKVFLLIKINSILINLFERSSSDILEQKETLWAPIKLKKPLLAKKII
jgi:hypothetical protein